MSYTQCTFKKEGKQEFTQAWIDTKHAIKGRFVQLIDLGKEFWEVTFAGMTQEEDPNLKYRTWNNNI